MTGVEVFFDANDIIVSKTNLKGHITYANDVFLDIAGYTEEEVLGKPHSLIRHPKMPRCVFKLLWDTIQAGDEIFAYVINRAKNGDHYWVLAHVTPSYDSASQMVGFHSNRRVANRDTLTDVIIPLYDELLATEQAGDRKSGLEASTRKLTEFLSAKNMTANQYFLSLA
ncbi:PAS domain-containing protein [Kordiimonas sp. A6E486]|nr:PAS domain-containing protein [Kordiimonas marina]